MKNAFLGIDVSKGYADIIILDAHQKPLCKHFKCQDNAVGHKKMISTINKVLKEYDIDVLYCGMESTGGYENNWYRTLRSIDHLKVSRINPVRIHNEGKTQMTRVVTDEVAASIIAIHLSKHYDKLFSHVEPNMEMADARKVYRTITQLQRHATAMTNQLEKLLYDNTPELLTFCRHGFSKTLLRVLAKYPSKKALSNAKLKGLAKIKGMSEKKGQEIKDSIKNSVGSEGNKFLAYAIQTSAEQILDTQTKIDKHRAFLGESFSNEQVEILSGMAGIGKNSAVALVIEIEDVHRFESASKISAYFGVHPVYKISGDGSTKPRMSKQGRASMRAVLFMIAKNVIQKDPYFKSIYIAKRKEGRNYFDTMGIIMHKLLRVIYGMLKSNKPYDPNYGKDIQKKSKPSSSQLSDGLSKMEEQLKELQNSPCSRRSINKIKKKIQAYKDNLIDNKIP